MCYLFQKIEVNMTRISLNFLVVLLFSIVFSALLVESTDEEAAVLIESNLVLAKSASSKKDLTILKKRDSLLDSITKNVKNLEEPNINDSESEERKYSDEKKMNKNRLSLPRPCHKTLKLFILLLGSLKKTLNIGKYYRKYSIMKSFPQGKGTN